MKRFKLKGICLGVLFAFAGSLVVSLIAASYFMDSARSIDQLLQNNSYLFVVLIGSLLVDFLAGYLAVRVAKSFPYHNSGAVGFVSFSYALSGLATYIEKSPLWYVLPSFLLIIPASLLGGYLAAKKFPQSCENE